MKIGIIGAGSLGLLWATRLIKYHAVTLLCRTEEQASIIRQSGIELTTLLGEKETYHVSAEWIQQSIHSAPFDVLFLMVKQPIVDEILPLIPGLIHPDTAIVAWQNGLGHVEKIQSLHHPHIYAVVTTEGAHKISANQVRHTGKGYKRLGHLLQGPITDPKISYLIDQMGIEMVTNITFVLWEKFAINCVINPLTALLEVRNGELLRSEIEPIMDHLIRETCCVANYRGIPLHYEGIYHQVRSVSHKTANNFSSMLQDVQAKRQTEISALNQMVVRYGNASCIPVPYHQLITQLILAKSMLS